MGARTELIWFRTAACGGLFESCRWNFCF